MFGAAPSLSDIAAVTGNNNRNNGFGDGEGWWVLIILFALFGGWGRNGGLFGVGNGGYSGECGCGTPATCGDLQAGFNNQAVTNKLNGLENGLSSLGYDQLAQMNGINQNISATGYGIQSAITNMGIASMQDTNSLSRQLADCCCENRQAIAQVRYDMAANACSVTTAIANAARDITDNQNANYRALHDEIVANRMEDKNAQIQSLQSQVQALNLAQSQANQNTYLISQLRPTPVPAYQVANPYAGFGYGCCGCATQTGCGCC